MRFFKSKTKKLPRAVEKSLLPREEFIVREKERFLAAFDASALAQNTNSASGRPAYMTEFFKIGIGALAVLFIGAGLSAYADTANVSATNPLYSLKRIGENVQLALAPASEKPQLQATFAVRRANEIAALQTSAPSSTLIPQLTSDLDQDINTSLSALTGGGSNGAAQATSSVSSTVTVNPAPTPLPTASVLLAASTSASTSVDAAPIEVYCNAFKVSTSGVLIGQLEATLALRENGFAEFNEECASSTSSAHQVPQKNPNRRDHSPINGTSTTPQASGDDHAGAFFGYGYGEPTGNPSATTTTTTTATSSSATATTSIQGSVFASASIPYIPPTPPVRL